MQFKQKLAYMALGGALVFLGQLSAIMLGSRATAQSENSSVAFDTVTCRQLKLVDGSGRTYLLLQKDPLGDGEYSVMQVFNSSGKAVCQIAADTNGGYVSVNASRGRGHAYLKIHHISNGGVVRVSDKTGQGGAVMSITGNTGVLNVRDGDGKVLAQMGVTESGGLISVIGKDNDGFALMSADKVWRSRECERQSASRWRAHFD